MSQGFPGRDVGYRSFPSAVPLARRTPHAHPSAPTSGGSVVLTGGYRLRPRGIASRPPVTPQLARQVRRLGTGRSREADFVSFASVAITGCPRPGVRGIRCGRRGIHSVFRGPAQRRPIGARRDSPRNDCCKAERWRSGGVWLTEFGETLQHKDPTVEGTCPDAHTPLWLFNPLGQSPGSAPGLVLMTPSPLCGEPCQC